MLLFISIFLSTVSSPLSFYFVLLSLHPVFLQHMPLSFLDLILCVSVTLSEFVYVSLELAARRADGTDP